MKKKKGSNMKKILISASVWLLLLTGACTVYDYDGISREPLDSDAKVRIFTSEEQTPVSGEKLGVLRFTSNAGATSGDIYKALMNQAREHGADIILIRKMAKIPAGKAREDQLRNEQAPSWNRIDNSTTSARYMTNTIEYADVSDPEKTIYRTEVEAEFLRGK